jgi:RNA polymerase sigma-70 factor (ECF subfamily)
MRTDESLAFAVQQGKEADMNELVERYYEAILRYLYRICGGRQTLAEDMVQETFLRMMRGIVSYDPKRPFKPWLYAIASNIARNYFQRADTKRTDNPAEDADFADEHLLPEIAVMQSEHSQEVSNAIMQLAEHYRAVVVLFYFEELAQKDIAQILGIPVGTVKSRLSNGLKQLRAMLETIEETL